MRAGASSCAGCGKPTTQTLWMDDEYQIPLCPRCYAGGGVACPVGCGRCCDELWRKVPAFKRAKGRVCPSRLPTGVCGIRPRDDMPRQCRHWVCALGAAVLGRKVTLRRARVLVARGLQWDPQSWGSAG